MIQSRSSGHAKAYFSDALLKSDYYTSDQELAGYWEGRLANRLGIKSFTDKDSFFALCENRHPLTGENLTPRTKEERTTGYDINFHCPKSVSVLHMLSDDDHILKAFQDSVTDTMKLIEADSKTRVRKEGQYDDRKTGELVWANFIHQTARPVEGYAPDPHLHSHCFVFNATWDEAEQKIKACQFRDIKRDMPFYQSYFHKELSDKLMQLGYRIKKTDKSFEVEGISKEVIGLFSKRTDEIGRIAKEKGITDAKELGELGAKSRSKKQKGTSMAELKKQWVAQINTLDVVDKGKAEDEKPLRFAEQKEPVRVSAQECVDYALLHCFERASVVPDRRLLDTAFRHSLGKQSVSVKDIMSQFSGNKKLIRITENNRVVCTTQEVLNEEKKMVDLARKGQGKLTPLYSSAPDLTLKGQQAEAVNHILTTANRVSIIRGAAGSGKTTLMKEAVSKIEQAGKKVMVVAPTAQASRGVLKQEGFTGAETVAQLLVSKKMQEELKGQVLWVDEAGLLGTKDMLSLLEITTKQNARLILGGDTRQHASVVRGDALRILNTVGGIYTAEVSKIYRQKNETYRSAVENLAKGDVSQAFEKLDEMNFIKTIDPLKPNDILVNDYVEAIRQNKTALIISPTHAQGDEVTAAIRLRLKSEGRIAKKEIAVKRFVNLNLTEAEKKEPWNFQTSQVIQFTQNARGFERGSSWVVDAAGEDLVKIKNISGQEKSLPTAMGSRFEVFDETKINLSKGDRIRITKNGFDKNQKRLNNGDTLTVESVSKKGKIVLKNEISKASYTIDKDFGHIAHAHCITSHASQGKTVDEVFISQPSSTFPATDAKQFYVSVSRGREKAHIYTEDKEALLQHAKELRERQSALELVGTTERHKDYVIQQQRSEKAPAKTIANKNKIKTKFMEDYEPES